MKHLYLLKCLEPQSGTGTHLLVTAASPELAFDKALAYLGPDWRCRAIVVCETETDVFMEV